MKDIVIISFKGFENYFLNSLKIFVGILFEPFAVFVFIELIRSYICPPVLLEKENCYCFQGQDMKDKSFALTIFLFIFSAILVKKLLKWLEIFGNWSFINYQLGDWK